MESSQPNYDLYDINRDINSNVTISQKLWINRTMESFTLVCRQLLENEKKPEKWKCYEKDLEHCVLIQRICKKKKLKFRIVIHQH